MGDLSAVIESIRNGRTVIIYDGDGREHEADMVIPAGAVTPKMIAKLRKDAGGLICLGINSTIASSLGLPFMTDILLHSDTKILNKIAASSTPYGDRPAFSISINHKRTFTGITDNDRALTISEFAKLAVRPTKSAFQKNFYSPGHVHLLIGSSLKERKGHTELSLALAELSGIPHLMVMCEMLDGKTGKALSAKDALLYARKNSIPFIKGEEITKAVFG